MQLVELCAFWRCVAALRADHARSMEKLRHAEVVAAEVHRGAAVHTERLAQAEKQRQVAEQGISVLNRHMFDLETTNGYMAIAVAYLQRKLVDKLVEGRISALLRWTLDSWCELAQLTTRAELFCGTEREDHGFESPSEQPKLLHTSRDPNAILDVPPGKAEGRDDNEEEDGTCATPVAKSNFGMVEDDPDRVDLDELQVGSVVASASSSAGSTQGGDMVCSSSDEEWAVVM